MTLGTAYAMTNRPQKNDFGMHEFIDLCKLSGADSYITLNTASVQPLDAYRRMEYCNIPRGPEAWRCFAKKMARRSLSM